MQEQTAQQILHRLYQGDDSTPSTSDSDYTVRRSYLNDAIRQWEVEDQWRELYVTLADASDGAKTTTASTATYSAPSDFRQPVGFLRITDSSSGTETYYTFIDVDRVQLFDNDTSSKFYYVTGNPQDGYTIHIHPTPDTTGETIAYEYYKTADTLSSTTDVFEMSDPYYAIYYALSVLFENDGQGDRAMKALAQANDRLQRMKINNLVYPAYSDNSIPDVDFNTGVLGFGE